MYVCIFLVARISQFYQGFLCGMFIVAYQIIPGGRHMMTFLFPFGVNAVTCLLNGLFFRTSEELFLIQQLLWISMNTTLGLVLLIAV